MLNSNIHNIQRVVNPQIAPNQRPNTQINKNQVSFGCAMDAGIPEMTAFLATSAILRRVAPQKAEQLNNYVSKLNFGKFHFGEKLAKFEKWGSHDYKACFKDINNFIHGQI